MKADGEVECLKWNGTAFTSGHLYKITYVWDNGDFEILNNYNERAFFTSSLVGSYFRHVESRMPEPMFDLDDMELAEILIEEIENAR